LKMKGHIHLSKDINKPNSRFKYAIRESWSGCRSRKEEADSQKTGK